RRKMRRGRSLFTCQRHWLDNTRLKGGWKMFSGMWHLVDQAPYFIFFGFVGSFFLTFTVVKVSQSDTVYEWFTGKVEVWKAKQARKIRLEMMEDLNAFLRGRKEQELSSREQHLYYQMLDSYFSKIEKLYPAPENEEGENV